MAQGIYCEHPDLYILYCYLHMHSLAGDLDTVICADPFVLSFT